MNSKPIVANKLYAVHTSYVVDFTLTNNIILIMGDSGTGKSVIFSILQEAASSDDRIFLIWIKIKILNVRSGYSRER